MMLSVALIALGYIVAVVGADSNSVIVAGLLIRLVLPPSFRSWNTPSKKRLRRKIK